MFKKFRNEQPQKSGFYVFLYKDGRELKVYCDKPSHHYANIFSYFAVTFNDRDASDCGMDFGQHVWCNSFTTEGPIDWREMTSEEALDFSKMLFRFGRPSWAHKNGRKLLKLSDLE